MRIAFTLREHIFVISEINIQQRQDPMSEESNLVLEEMEEGSTRMDTHYFLRGWVQGIVKNY